MVLKGKQNIKKVWNSPDILGRIHIKPEHNKISDPIEIFRQLTLCNIEIFLKWRGSRVRSRNVYMCVCLRCPTIVRLSYIQLRLIYSSRKFLARYFSAFLFVRHKHSFLCSFLQEYQRIINFSSK